MKKKLIVIAVALLCCIGVAVAMWQTGALKTRTWQETTQLAADQTTKYAIAEIQNTENAAGDKASCWGVMALCRSGAALPEGFLTDYLAEVEQLLNDCDGDLIGESSKFNTEYCRMTLMLTAAGYDASNFAGYDLTAPLMDFEETTRQGLNGAAYALLALDAGAYECPIRQDYVDYLLSLQLADGGWALGNFEVADSDVTAIVLQALSKYLDQPEVSAAVESGVTCLSQMQLDNGSFVAMGGECPESCAQVILAMCELGIDLEDERFVKNGNTVLDAMLRYQNKDGSFNHAADQAPMPVSAYQSLMALSSLQRCDRGVNPFYTMP